METARITRARRALRAVAAVAALYALVLQALLGSATALPLIGAPGMICSPGTDGAVPDGPGLPGHHHAGCCTAARVAAPAPPPLVAAGATWPARAMSAIVWRPAASVPLLEHAGSRARARAPPAA